MRLLKVSPLIPEDVVISGAVYDVEYRIDLRSKNDHIEENRKRERSLFPVLLLFYSIKKVNQIGKNVTI